MLFIHTTGSEQYYDIYADKDTGVMYLYVYTGRGFGSGLTVMLNADGTPKIWQGEEQEKKVLRGECAWMKKKYTRSA